MSTSFIPQRESELVPYTNNFSAKLTALFASVGCTTAQATTFAGLNTTWVNSYAIAIAPSTRTRDTIATKNQAKNAVVANLRILAKIIQAYPGTTDALRSQFGLTIHKPYTPIPVPTVMPVLEVTKRYGVTVFMRLHDGTTRKTMPAGVQGARVYSFIGAVPPTDPNAWTFEGQTTRTDVEIQFPNGTAPGALVWFTAAWYSPRGQLGPGCQPVSTNIAGGAMSLAA